MQIFQSPVCSLDSFRCVELQHERFTQDHSLSQDGGPFAMSWFSAFKYGVWGAVHLATRFDLNAQCGHLVSM